MYPLWRCSGCEISLCAVCFQLQSDGTASVTDKVPVCPPTHTEEGVLLTEKSAYSPESAFPKAPLHARSPQWA